ncbi:CRR6 family NdhI maturation factor [Candidatus Atelocyanobacterium thalassae]|uniref:CRR6 family NdhI maturation factor n=2 Tax=Candidatus Atelocyanobacterium thalassae TaxID=713887 RepID=A0A086CI35_9CHRO|nr:CRR6 family NdhI maturation factor [Candidatus Atelocyanobacterium thalassa]KFF41849.1 MAG: hypothetical protein ucyna2_00228 [Candidatus Atelocyanobacterium thalassa isolate SIO64986]BDA40321.1 hypothetical protein CPARK_000115900 [cyanobacterium endosymbiont of Braarudosphaera bigelowii]
MTKIILIKQNDIVNLDISVITNIIEPKLKKEEVISLEQTFTFDIEYPQPSSDPRELSEISEIRLWFIRLDGIYPWIPFILDPKKGELARYTAMLVPHQFNRVNGIQYNSEALEIFVMHKLFIISDWLKKQNIYSIFRLKNIAQLLGYDVEENFFKKLS